MPKAMTADSKNSGNMTVHKQVVFISTNLGLWGTMCASGDARCKTYTRRVATHLASVMDPVGSSHTH